MEGELFKEVYGWVQGIVRPGPAGCHYSDRQIVLTYLWAVLHDRPVVWACQDRSLRRQMGWSKSPSDSTMSRRLARASCRQALDELEKALAACWPNASLKFIDGKPLAIGSCSKDPDASFGRAGSAQAKGYKVHAIKDAGGPVRAWQIQPMNVSETKVARTLLAKVNGPGELVGDGEYDAGLLYQRAAQQQLQLITKARHGAGRGHHRQEPYRLAGLAIARSRPGQKLLARRIEIDQYFGQWGNYGGGLSPLPNWVRRTRRVVRWVQGKLILHMVRQILRQGLAI